MSYNISELALACLAAILIFNTQSAEAQSVHETAKPKIVLLTASAKKLDKTEVIERKNGIIVSAAGWLLTSYGLIESFTEVEPGSLRITARGDATQDKEVRLTIIDYSEHLNLLFLALPAGKYPYFNLALEGAAAAPSTLLVSGYRSASGFYSGDGGPKLFTDDPENDSLRAINITHADILPGGPVYNSDGQLLGLVRGEDKNAEIFYTPISYAVPLLITVRADDIFNALNTRLPLDRALELDAALKELRTTVTFDPVVDPDANTLLIRYDKMLAEPAIAFLDVRVTAVDPPAEIKVGDPNGKRIWTKIPDPNDNTKGSFDATDDLYKLVEATQITHPATAAFKFHIVGELESRTKIPSVEIERKSPFLGKSEVAVQ